MDFVFSEIGYDSLGTCDLPDPSVKPDFILCLFWI